MAALTAAGPAAPVAQDPAGPSPTADRPPGALAFYRALGDTVTGPLRRPRVAIPLEIGLLVAWLVIRSTTPADGPLYLAWAIVVAVVAILSPLSGLVILVAIAPFDEPYTVSRAMGLKHVLVAVLAVSVAARVALRPRSLPVSWALVGAAGIAAGTLAGLVLTFRRFGADFGIDSAELWLAGIGGGMLVLIAATWIARDGELRPLVTATIAGVAAAIVSLADYLAPGVVSNSPFEWLVHLKDFGQRLSGVIPSPNGVVALLLPPAAILAAAVVFYPGWRVRAASLAGLLPVAAAIYFAYSRTAFLAAFGFVVIAAWRIRRWLGVLVLATGIVAGSIALPAYLQLRAEATGAAVVPGTMLVATDEARFVAWRAAFEMWQDRPLTGFGFRSYKPIGDSYGDRVLNSPHNEWLRLFAEEGVLVGLVGLAFVIVSLVRLARVPGWLGAGTLAGFLGYVIAASFNNPFLFIQVSIIAFTIAGTGLAWGSRWPAAGHGTPGSGTGPAVAVTEQTDPDPLSATADGPPGAA